MNPPSTLSNGFSFCHSAESFLSRITCDFFVSLENNNLIILNSHYYVSALMKLCLDFLFLNLPPFLHVMLLVIDSGDGLLKLQHVPPLISRLFPCVLPRVLLYARVFLRIVLHSTRFETLIDWRLRNVVSLLVPTFFFSYLFLYFRRSPLIYVSRRSCIRRGGSCDHRRNDCCFSSSCRCNLWGSNCRCHRAGLFQKWG